MALGVSVVIHRESLFVVGRRSPLPPPLMAMGTIALQFALAAQRLMDYRRNQISFYQKGGEETALNDAFLA